MNTYNVEIYRGKSLNKTFQLPGSKSITNRALIIAALANGTTRLTNFLSSDDTIYMAEALKKMGVSVHLDIEHRVCEVSGATPPDGDYQLMVGNAGTAMRFLTSYLCLGKGKRYLDGDSRMRERPIGDLLNALMQLGCDIHSENQNECPPLVIRANGVRLKECSISGKKSSQYISSLLLSSPYFENGLKLSTLEDVSSKPYIDMTIRMMLDFGISVQRSDYREFIVENGVYQSPKEYSIEPDASTASYFLAAAAILSGKMEITGLGQNSIQGDVAFAEVLHRMGCGIFQKPNGILVQSDGILHGVDIDMNELPDMVPTLAITALFADSPTTIRNVENLRIKESDRISALVTELKKLGAEVEEYPDGLKVIPNDRYFPTIIHTYNDHRIAMSFAIAGLKIDGIKIENPSCVSKSFPEFFQYLERFCVTCEPI